MRFESSLPSTLKIQIPNPCAEDWSKMTPATDGRYCDVCAKTVVDFSNWPLEAIENYFDAHANERICGRFKPKQLNTIHLQIPANELVKLSLMQQYLWVLLIVFGSTLFSCTDKAGQQATFGDIQIVDSSIGTNQTEAKTGFSKVEKIVIDTLEPNFVTLMGDVIPTGTTEIEDVDEEVPEDFTNAIDSPKVNMILGMIGEIMPEYPGGEEKMYKFLKENIQYPKDTLEIKGKVVVSFVVCENGEIRELKIEKSLCKAYDEEVLRVMQLMPRWKPGEQLGKFVEVKMMLPINFSSN